MTAIPGVMGIKQTLTGAPPREVAITVSSLTIAANTVCYLNAGTLTISTSGTAAQYLNHTAIAAADTVAHVFELKGGDILEGPYNGAVTNLKIGDSVDIHSDGAQFAATDETVGTAGHFRVDSIDTANTRLAARYIET